MDGINGLDAGCFGLINSVRILSCINRRLGFGCFICNRLLLSGFLGAG